MFDCEWIYDAYDSTSFYFENMFFPFLFSIKLWIGDLRREGKSKGAAPALGRGGQGYFII